MQALLVLEANTSSAAGMVHLSITSHPQEINTAMQPTNDDVSRILHDILVHSNIIDSNSSSSSSDPDPYSYYYEDGQAGRRDYIAAAVPVCVSVLSIVCCYITMRESWADYRKSSQGVRRQDSGSAALALQNFLAAACYFFYSFCLVWGPLPAPAEIPFSWTKGTQATCSAQGFLVQVGVTLAALEHSFLIWMYVLLVRYNWSELNLRRCVYTGAGVATVVSLGMAMVPAILGYYNYNSETKCWIATFPYRCNHYDNEDVNCIRGASANQLQMLYFLFPHWLLMVCNITSMCLIWCAVRKIENLTTKYAGSTVLNMRQQIGEVNTESGSRRSDGDTTSRMVDSLRRSHEDESEIPTFAGGDTGAVSQPQEETVEMSVNRTKSKAIATQGILLSLGFLFVLGISSLEVIFKNSTGWSPFWLAQISNAFIASPGLFFFFVFCYPREKSMNTTEGRFVRRYILGCFYIGWNRIFEFAVPSCTKTKVSVRSSTSRHHQRSSQLDLSSQNIVAIPEPGSFAESPIVNDNLAN